MTDQETTKEPFKVKGDAEVTFELRGNRWNLLLGILSMDKMLTLVFRDTTFNIIPKKP